MILLGAIALGVLAAFALFQYVSGIEEEAEEDLELTPVFRATESIPQGTFGNEAVDSGLVEADEIPKKFKPDGAIESTDQIRDDVALFDIPAGIPITDQMFVPEAETQTSFRRRLQQPDWVTATISVDQVGGVAGLLVPGDEVNMMLALEAATEGGEAPPEVAGGGWVLDSHYEVLYQKVHILAIGQEAQLLPGEEQEEGEGGGGGAGGGGLITFNVPPDAAQLIASAQLDASLYLSLVPEEYEPAPIEPPDPVIDVLPGQNPDELTPYGPDGDGTG